METGNSPGGLYLFPDPTTREMIPEHLLDRYQVMPLGRKGAKLILGMVSGLDRKNCWTIAEHRGATTPDGLQHLLSRARWDAWGTAWGGR